jgi:hypothetical protein
MTNQIEPTTRATGAVLTRIDLEDFIEAVARGVARAGQAEDEVGGYALIPPGPGPIIIGLVLPPTDGRTPKPGPIMPVPPGARKVE